MTRAAASIGRIDSAVALSTIGAASTDLSRPLALLLTFRPSLPGADCRTVDRELHEAPVREDATVLHADVDRLRRDGDEKAPAQHDECESDERVEVLETHEPSSV